MPNRLLTVAVAFTGVYNEASHDGKVVVHAENLIDEHVTVDMKHYGCACSHFIHRYKCDSLHLLGMHIYAEWLNRFKHAYVSNDRLD